MSCFNLHSSKQFLIFVFFLLLPSGLFFGKILWGDRQFAYRDVACFYYPLFEQVQTEWNKGRIPLWDPYENLGQPLAANLTSSVFYPVKLIFFLAGRTPLSYAGCFKIYIVFHVLLAFSGMYFLMRFWIFSPGAASISAIAFTFSGSILFQYSNPIFLVGAAWLPWAIAMGHSFIKQARWGNFIVLVGILCMILLGGEPQTVYLTILLLFALLGVDSFYARRIIKKEDQTKQNVEKNFSQTTGLLFFSSNSRHTSIQKRLLMLILVCVTTIGLTAFQLLPTIEMSRFSERSVHSPGSRFQQYWSNYILCDQIEQGGHAAAQYRFSTAPWRFPELLYPNFGGCQFPQHSRWMSALPNEIAVWVPSLYMGLLPVLLAITAFRFRWRDSLPPDQSSPTQTFSQSETPWNRNPFQTLNDRHVIQVWISWLTIGFLLASMGGFGIVWGIRTVQHIILGTPVPASFVNGDPIGGLYWLLNGLIPKFSLFRYPAKLMTFATFGLAVLAGFGWDFNITNTIQQHNHQKTGITLLQKLIWGLLIFSVCLLVLLGIFKNVFLTRLQITPDSLYGPWQATLCFQSVRNSLIQTVLLTTVLSLLLSPCSFLQDLPTGQNILSRFSRPSKADFLPSVTSSKPDGIFKWLKEKQGIILLLLLVADIYLANRWMIVTVPQKYFDRCPGFVSAIRQKQPPSDHQPPTRILRHPIWFPQAFQQESSTGRISERIIWDRASLFPKYSYRYGIAVIDVRGTMMNNDYYHFSNLIRTHHDIDKTLEFLDVSYRIEPINSKAHLTRYRPVDMNHQKWCPRDTVLLKIQKPTTRVKIIHSGQDSLSAQEKQAESVQILDYTPNRIQYKAKLVKKADLLFVEQYAPGWQVIVTPDTTGVKQNSPDNNINSQKSFSVPVVKSHHFLRKITLPAGTFDITMEYRPQSFYVGLSVTIVTGTLLLLLGIISSVFGILPKR